MRLTVAERMALLDMLPVQGNIVTLRLLTELKLKVALSEEELTKYEVKQVKEKDGRVFIQWAPEFDKLRVDIPISDHEKGVVIRTIMQLDSQSQLTVHSLPLYDYFVDNKEPEET